MAGRVPGDPADPYRVLGVPATASRAEIVRAYRRLARSAHPDTRPGDSAEADRFHEVTAAYELLTDPQRRARYDRAHPQAGASAGPQASAAAPGPAAARSPQWPPGSRPPGTRRPSPWPPGAGQQGVQPPIWAGPVRVDPPPGHRQPAAPGPSATPRSPWPGTGAPRGWLAAPLTGDPWPADDLAWLLGRLLRLMDWDEEW